MLLVAAGSGAATLGIPGSAGVPAGAAQDTLIVPFNDADAVEHGFSRRTAATIAGVIVEPVCGNMGFVLPAPGYLERAARAVHRQRRDLHLRRGDDRLPGRLRRRPGAVGVTPDLTCWARSSAVACPSARIGGRADIMEKLAPLGPVYQAGTLSGNPLAMAAGLKTLEILRRPGTYERLEVAGATLERDLLAAASAAGVPALVNRVGSMLTLFFTATPVTDYASAKTSDTSRFAAFFRGMRDRGVFLPPSQYEAMFVSLAHTDGDLAQIGAAARAALGG
jgi:glutamate-1-semialdehyde 2,1-aminomutase